MEPKAGHCVRLIAVRALSPWPWWPQKQHVAFGLLAGLALLACPLFGVGWVRGDARGVEIWGRFGLKGVALADERGVGWRCCCL